MPENEEETDTMKEDIESLKIRVALLELEAWGESE